MNRTISELMQTDRRYQRSAHLERDFTDASALLGYVTTPHIEEMLQRVISGIQEHPNRRAFRVTGNYGSGKSSFALLLAHILHTGFQSVPLSIQERFQTEFPKQAPNLLPVLVTGSREPINAAVLRALLHTIETRVHKHFTLQAFTNVKALLRGNGEKLTDELALKALQAANEELIDRTDSNGLLIVLDELGKFLEFAALHPERQDVFFLQQLAEMSCRSGAKPILFVGLLHQHFNAYADNLPPTEQREWAKVAGRFDELPLVQSSEQIVRLIGSALNISSNDRPSAWEFCARHSMKSLAEENWFGADAVSHSLLELAPALYPLHPSVVPVVTQFFANFGQNERSLFGFLLSDELGGLQEFARNTPPSPYTCYRLYDFYDYVAINYGDRLGALSLQNHWNHINAAVCSLAQWPEKAKAAKSIGILNLLQKGSFLVATEPVLFTALADTPKEREVLRETLRVLKKDQFLYFRGKSGGYCLWSHTSVNLLERYQEADRSLIGRRKVVDAISDKLDTRPLVAQRHYIETGNLRSFEIVYCSPDDLVVRAQDELVGNDCRILIPLCETPQERTKCMDFARKYKRAELLIGIPQPLNGLEGFVQELDRWEWVKNNTPELKDDTLAAQEVEQKWQQAKDALERRVQYFIGLRQSDASMPLSWFRNGKDYAFESGQKFLSWLSEICQKLFLSAPKVHNELVNRRVPSGAAAAARMKLIDRMFRLTNQPFLGMDEIKRPPEMSMYFSVLQNTLIHRKRGQNWIIDFPPPSDPANLLPALEAIREKLKSTRDSRISAIEIFSMLRASPYGVREGLVPLLLVVVLIKYHRDIAVFENGVFLQDIAAEEILRLTKAPATFALQWCQVGGLRLTVFERLLVILEAAPEGRKEAELLDVVKPLMGLVAGLPYYARHTKGLSNAATQVREVLLNAENPATMLFEDLPKACGSKPLSLEDGNGTSKDKKRAELFVDALREALDELRGAFPELLGRITAHLSQVFDLEGAHQISELRSQLAQRAGGLAPLVADTELKGFCLRLADVGLDDGAWLESFGSFVVGTPPSRWKNQDEHAFSERLHYLVGKFCRTEAAAFASLPKNSTDKRVLLTITQGDGEEKSQVIHLTPKQTALVEELKEKLREALLADDIANIAAMSQLSWDLLSTRKKK